MAPWLNYAEIMERQQTYDFAAFKNEVLGLPTTLGEHIVTPRRTRSLLRRGADGPVLWRTSPS